MKDRDKVIIVAVVSLLSWLAVELYQSMQDRIDGNRESIQALIALHMK